MTTYEESDKVTQEYFKQKLEEEKKKPMDQRVEEALERIRPAIQSDGGDVVLEGVNEEKGLVFLRLHGSCVGCPSSQMTLKSGIERIIKEYVPEISEVVTV